MKAYCRKKIFNSMIIISCFISLEFWVIGYSRSLDRILIRCYCGTKVDVDTNALHDMWAGCKAWYMYIIEVGLLIRISSN